MPSNLLEMGHVTSHLMNEQTYNYIAPCLINIALDVDPAPVRPSGRSYHIRVDQSTTTMARNAGRNISLTCSILVIHVTPRIAM